MFNKKEYDKEYALKHKEYFKNYHKKYDELHKKTKVIKEKNNLTKDIKEYHKNYYQTHKQDKNIYYKKYNKIKRNNSISFKILHNLRVRMVMSLKNKLKSENTIKLLGCNIEQFKQHLESQFKEGMSWDNYGRGWNYNENKQWHIDHVIPCCRFDMSKEEDQRRCFHYTNLRPLWAKDNWCRDR